MRSVSGGGSHPRRPLHIKSAGEPETPSLILGGSTGVSLDMPTQRTASQHIAIASLLGRAQQRTSWMRLFEATKAPCSSNLAIATLAVSSIQPYNVPQGQKPRTPSLCSRKTLTVRAVRTARWNRYFHLRPVCRRSRSTSPSSHRLFFFFYFLLLLFSLRLLLCPFIYTSSPSLPSCDLLLSLSFSFPFSLPHSLPPFARSVEPLAFTLSRITSLYLSPPLILLLLVLSPSHTHIDIDHFLGWPIIVVSSLVSSSSTALHLARLKAGPSLHLSYC